MALWVVIALLVFALFNLFQGTTQRGQQTMLAYSDFLTSVEAGEVRDVTIKGSEITGHYRDGRNFSTYAPENSNVVPTLTSRGVRISALPSDEDSPTLFSILISWFPMLLLIGVWIFFMRQMQSGGGKAMGFGKS
ncbi:MAG: ATP-dependent metallopeptidase FtsH/Yme1/Tma family protein, partial [Rhodospirillales bacterium]